MTVIFNVNLPSPGPKEWNDHIIYLHVTVPVTERVLWKENMVILRQRSILDPGKQPDHTASNGTTWQQSTER